MFHNTSSDYVSAIGAIGASWKQRGFAWMAFYLANRARCPSAVALPIRPRSPTEAPDRTLSLPPAEAFLKVRLSHVRMLLTRSRQSISQIAAEAGFCDASHLIRVFRERTGTTPEAWRHGTSAND